MPTIIIYVTDTAYLDRTIDSIIDHTHDVTVVVCDDVGLNWARDGVTVRQTDKIGRAKAWNLAAADVDGTIVFMKDKVKVSSDWMVELEAMLKDDGRRLISPVVHTLDLSLWLAESGRWKRFGWRWDLRLYDRVFHGGDTSPAISSSCFACTKEWFTEIGGFDDGMKRGAGEDVEISLRSWLFGGSVAVCDDSTVAVAFEIDHSAETMANLARIADIWLERYASLFYRLNDVAPTTVDSGRLNIERYAGKQVKSIQWFLDNIQPELLWIYDVKDMAVGKRIAVVAPGPSIDHIAPSEINRYDIVIGVDYAGLLFDCDYVVANTVHVIGELKKKYTNARFFTPTAIQDRSNAALVAANSFVPGAKLFELQANGSSINSVNPPFCGADNLALTAAHIAIFMKPVSITVFGHDGKLIGGKSHTAKIEYYDGGKIWPDSENTRRQFAIWEHWFDQLGKLALDAGIPFFRMLHA